MSAVLVLDDKLDRFNLSKNFTYHIIETVFYAGHKRLVASKFGLSKANSKICRIIFNKHLVHKYKAHFL